MKTLALRPPCTIIILQEITRNNKKSDEHSQLEQNHLPPPDAFYSSLRDANTLSRDPAEIQQNYDRLKKLWNERGWRTMKDLLIHYSSQDGLPFVAALTQMQNYYRLHKAIDLFRDGISVPGLARRLLFRCARSCPFALFSSQDEDLFRLYRRQLVGGPSIIYNRLTEAHSTPVGPHANAEICKLVTGLDANGLYGFCLSNKMPIGPHVRWRPVEGGAAAQAPPTAFRASRSQKYMSSFYWLDYMATQQNCRIQHYLNTGYEISVGGYFLDSFCPESNTAYEYDGCWSHGHRCLPATNDPRELTRRQMAAARTEMRLRFLRQHVAEVIAMRECEFKAALKQNGDMRAFVESHEPTFYRRHN